MNINEKLMHKLANYFMGLGEFHFLFIASETVCWLAKHGTLVSEQEATLTKQRAIHSFG